MKNKKTAADYCLEQLEAEIESFMKSIAYDDAIRMQFLEQSARYLGVYVENTPINLFEDRIKS